MTILALLLVGCGSGSSHVPVAESESVWSVDLVRLLPDGGDEYVGNIRDNWAQARDIALEDGDVISFRALIAEPDSVREWDIILMTEYRDSLSWANRETVFSEIFESARFVRVPTVRPSSELRAFISSGVVLTEIVSGEKVLD